MPEQVLTLLAVDLLEPNPFQPRSKIQPEDVADLADSIRQFGVLEPLVVAKTPAGFQIIAGERRWRAAKSAGLKEVPVHVVQTTPRGMLEMALIENVQRLDLSALERAQAFQQLIREFNHSVSQIAQKISKSDSFVSNSLRLLKLPDAIKDGLTSGAITEGHARALAGLEDIKPMVEIFKKILKENASVRRAEELVRLVKERQTRLTGQENKPRFTSVDDSRVRNWQKSLANILLSQSSVKLTRSARQTKITITLQGDSETTQQDLETIMNMSTQLKSARKP